MNILLVDDHQLFTDGMVLLLANFSASDEVSVEVAPNVRRALSIIDSATQPFQLIITDLQMSSGNEGHDFLRVMKHRDYPAPIVILSSSDEFDDMNRAFINGADGYLLKSERAFDILNKLKLIHADERVFPDAFWERYTSMDKSKQLSVDVSSPITGRLLEVLELISKGRTNKEISQLLSISEHTVKFHLRKLFVILGATNRASCVRVALDKGFL